MNWTKYANTDMNNIIYYQGVSLGVTVENFKCYIQQTGFEPEFIILKLYNNKIATIRDKKIDDILNY
jgi:hypothetical protein